jgi:uncharacterized DUF497 family protein
MIILWDEPKRLANLDKHGMDFADLTFDFFLDAITVPARKGRCFALGRLKNGVIAVVFLTLGNEALSVISMRPASKRERSFLNGKA